MNAVLAIFDPLKRALRVTCGAVGFTASVTAVHKVGRRISVTRTPVSPACAFWSWHRQDTYLTAMFLLRRYRNPLSTRPIDRLNLSKDVGQYGPTVGIGRRPGHFPGRTGD
jgi:hypothetical protein